MTIKTAGRLVLDLAMTLLLLLSLAYRIIGDAAHEWIGLSAFALYSLHHIVNRSWYRLLFSGKWHWRNAFNTAIDILLFLAMATLIVTGILMSRKVFAFLHAGGSMQLRQVHTTAAYWGFVLISVHIGMHWEMIIKSITKSMSQTSAAGAAGSMSIAFTILALGVAAYGVKSFLERDMVSKLFLGYSFDFWDPARPAILFFIANLAIIGLFAGITYYAVKLAKGKRR